MKLSFLLVPAIVALVATAPAPEKDGALDKSANVVEKRQNCQLCMNHYADAFDQCHKSGQTRYDCMMYGICVASKLQRVSIS
jgi:hypothetical protein